MTVKVRFVDFWPHFSQEDNYFTRLLSGIFKVEISEDPDFVFFSNYGFEHLKYKCIRIFYNGENQRTDWNGCDFSFSFDYLNDPRHFRMTNWIWYDDVRKLMLQKPQGQEALIGKTGFCNMVISNPYAKERIAFFHALSKYKKVDSGGRYLNNIGGPVVNKLEFIRRYKFTVAFENSSFPGYTTEKLFEPMFANSIPIYWGNPEVGRDFDTRSFVNANAFSGIDQMIDYIIELDKSDEKYFSLWRYPWYADNLLPECVDENLILNQMYVIVSSKGMIRPVATTGADLIYRSSVFLRKLDFELNSVFKYRKSFR